MCEFFDTKTNMNDKIIINILKELYILYPYENILSIMVNVMNKYNMYIDIWYDVLTDIRFMNSIKYVKIYYYQILKKLNLKLYCKKSEYSSKLYEYFNNKSLDDIEFYAKSIDYRDHNNLFIRKFDIMVTNTFEQWLNSVSFDFSLLKEIIKTNKTIITKNKIITFINNWNKKRFFKDTQYEVRKFIKCDNFDRCLHLLFNNYKGIDIDLIFFIFENTLTPFDTLYFRKIIRTKNGLKMIFDLALRLFLIDKINIVKNIQIYLSNYDIILSNFINIIMTLKYNENENLIDKFKTYVDIHYLLKYLQILFTENTNIRTIKKVINFIINMEYNIDNNIFEIIKTGYRNHKSRCKKKYDNIFDNLSKLIKKN